MILALSRKRDRLEELERLCRKRGISLTIQRRAVFQALLDGKDHPTADQVHRNVQRRLPGLSKTTVYRVLDTLVELGVISKVYLPGAPALFDTCTHSHHHLACSSCNKVIDLDIDLAIAPDIPGSRLHGFEIRETHVLLRGTCPDCLRTRSKRCRAGGTRTRARSGSAGAAKARSPIGKRTRTAKSR